MMNKWICPICGRRFEGMFVEEDITNKVIDHLAMHIQQLIKR